MRLHFSNKKLRRVSIGLSCVGLTLNLQIILISRPTSRKEGVTLSLFRVISMLAIFAAECAG